MLLLKGPAAAYGLPQWRLVAELLTGVGKWARYVALLSTIGRDEGQYSRHDRKSEPNSRPP